MLPGITQRVIGTFSQVYIQNGLVLHIYSRAFGRCEVQALQSQLDRGVTVNFELAVFRASRCNDFHITHTVKDNGSVCAFNVGLYGSA